MSVLLLWETAATMQEALELPLLSRSEIERAGARLGEPAGRAPTFLLQAYSRDSCCWL